MGTLPLDDISITKRQLKILVNTPDFDGFSAKMRINEQEFVRAFFPGNPSGRIPFNISSNLLIIPKKN